jgi:drug/metabolite transporter (DMT)-like permease
MSSATCRKPLDYFACGVMFLLCICWGLQQVAVKVAAADMHPVLQNGLRCVIAAVLIMILMKARRERFSLREKWFWAGIGTGVLFGFEFLSVMLGLTRTSASHMVVFLYTAPVFSALGLHWFVAGEHLRPRQWLGVAFAFCGIALAFSGSFSASADSRLMLLGDLLGLLGGILWAATILMVRASSLSEAPATQTLLYQLVVGAILLLGYSTACGQWEQVRMTPIAWANLIFQSVVIAFASYLAWFWLMRRYLATRLSAFSFLTPLFGVCFGVLLLGETLSPRFMAGAVFVLVGIVLVNFHRG